MARGWSGRCGIPASLAVPGALGWGCAELGTADDGHRVRGGGGCGAGCLVPGSSGHVRPVGHAAGAVVAAALVDLRWAAGGATVMEDCELFTTHRKTGADQFPRVVKVRAHSPTVDTVWVELARGQSLRSFTDKVEELCAALKVERIGVEKVKPRVVGLIVQRAEPFTEVIDAPEMPADSDAVDLSSIYLGDDEFGGEWRESLTGNHWFVAGATGAGKNRSGGRCCARSRRCCGTGWCGCGCATPSRWSSPSSRRSRTATRQPTRTAPT